MLLRVSRGFTMKKWDQSIWCPYAELLYNWYHHSHAHLLLSEGLLLVLRRLFLLVRVLFGTTFQELLGKVLGLGSVPQIGPDVVVHLVRRVHFFQEGSESRNWRGNRWRVFLSFGFQKLALSTAVGGVTLQKHIFKKTYHPDCWLCWGCAGFAHTIA